jgi:Calx-beta domain-containing protein/carboxypeptidase family protein/WD40 repeat protein
LRLTSDGLDDTMPTWSPDSQRIAFARSQGAGIQIINRDGTNLVSFLAFSAWPAWSPDGSRLAFIQNDSTIPFNGIVFTARIDGTDKVRVTNNPDGARAPSWAPTSSPRIPTFTISGQVKDKNGVPVNGATLTIFQIPIRTTLSDSSGNYSFTGLPTGTYKVDISKSGYGFIPTSITLTNINSDQTANFTAFVAFTISGQVTGAGPGLQVTLSGSESRSVFTELGGVYSFNLVPAGGNYTVSIDSPFFIITPPSITFNNLAADQTANFNAVIATYTISGTVTRLGLPKGGVTLQLRDTTGFEPLSTTSDANGHYAFTNVVAGRAYSVELASANYLSGSKGFPALDGNKTADFELRSANNMGLSRSTITVVEGVPSLQVSVLRGGNASGVGPITVDYTTADGTAKAGLDYTAVNGTLLFPEGTYSQTINIPILSDQVYEGPEQFSITLSNATGEVDLVPPSSAIVTITEIRLITESSSDRAIALNTASLVAEPFSVTTDMNFSDDHRTRISLFIQDLRGFQTFPTIIVNAVDEQQNHFLLPLEAVALYTSFPFQQLIVRLPENLTSQVMFVTISVNGSSSNTARISIKLRLRPLRVPREVRRQIRQGIIHSNSAGTFSKSTRSFSTIETIV